MAWIIGAALVVIGLWGWWSLYGWLVAQAGIAGALLAILLVPFLLWAVLEAVGRLRQPGRPAMGDPSQHIDPNKPMLVNYDDASGLGDWPTAYGDQPGRDSTPPGVEVEERDRAP